MRRSARRAFHRPSVRRTSWQKLRDLLATLAILSLVALLAARYQTMAAIEAAGVPVVQDGDSLTVDGERIRLRGIDAPELDQMCQRSGGDYACGRAARDALVDLMEMRPVACSGFERDRYGRLLGTCRAGETDLGAAMVEAGWAVAFGAYGNAERTARDAHRGLWAGSFERPRDWRARHGDMIDLDLHDVGGTAGWLRRLLRFP